MPIHAQQSGYRQIIVPQDNAREAAMADDLEVLPAKHLAEVVSCLSGFGTIDPVRIDREAIWNAAVTEIDNCSLVKGVVCNSGRG